MTVEPTSGDLLSEVARLCTQLADRALDEQMTGRPVPADQIAVLKQAALLLQDHGVT